MSVCLSVSQSARPSARSLAHLNICLAICLSIYPSVRLFTLQPVYFSLCPSVRLFVRPSDRPSVGVSHKISSFSTNSKLKKIKLSKKAETETSEHGGTQRYLVHHEKFSGQVGDILQMVKEGDREVEQSKTNVMSFCSTLKELSK